MVETKSNILKILFTIDSLRSGGKERRLTELIKILKLKKEIQFEIVTMNNEIHYEDVIDSSIILHYLIRQNKNDLTIFRKFYLICKQFKPDIVHCWDSMTAIYAIPTCKFLNIKLVNGLIVDSPNNQTVFNKYMLRAKLSFLFSDLIIGNSYAGIRAYNAPKQKSIVIHNGFDFMRIQNITPKTSIRKELKTETKYMIGMVATFSKFKDYTTFYKAAKLLLNRHKNITFLAIGFNTDHQTSTDQIEKEISSHFRFLGAQTNVENYVNSMDICVLSTFTEGISNSILEYMAMGKPVVATVGGGTSEIVEENITGFLVRPSDPKALCEKLEILLLDKTLRYKMGKAGQERVKSFFSIDSMVSLYISNYYRLLNKVHSSSNPIC